MTNIIQFESINDSFGNCECCGVYAELRPYGAGGRFICFECGQQDPEGTEERAYQVMNEAMDYERDLETERDSS